jgi:hypothetical protein
MLVIAPQADAASSAALGTTISLDIPVICKVVRRGEVGQQSSAYSLGQLFEYCNAPNGFRVEASYEPGTLQGTVVEAGGARVVLDGSGQSEIMHFSGPKISTVDVTATPGGSNFDPAGLQFQIIPL